MLTICIAFQGDFLFFTFFIMNKQPHIQAYPDQISTRVLLPGDPARVDIIGKQLDDFRIIANYREFRVGTGTYRNIPITVCSTGVGCPSTAIAVEELVQLGVKTLIRVGTCGGAWRSDIPAGSVIIPTASIRDEGTTKEYIPAEFPAVANFEVVSALINASVKQQVPFFSGINRTHDAFYGNQNSIMKWGEYLKDSRWNNVDTPILSSEMESAALFVISSLRNVRAGAIFAVNANPESLKNRITGKPMDVIMEISKDLTESIVNVMIQVALEAMTALE